MVAHPRRGECDLLSTYDRYWKHSDGVLCIKYSRQASILSRNYNKVSRSCRDIYEYDFPQSTVLLRPVL